MASPARIELALELGDLDLLKVLLVNAHAPDECCLTPLQEAVWQGHPDMVELLISKGADSTISGCGCSLSPMDTALREQPELLERLQSRRRDGFRSTRPHTRYRPRPFGR